MKTISYCLTLLGSAFIAWACADVIVLRHPNTSPITEWVVVVSVIWTLASFMPNRDTK